MGANEANGRIAPLEMAPEEFRSLGHRLVDQGPYRWVRHPQYAALMVSGFGMVLTLLIPVRSLCHLEEVITVRHIVLMGKVILATGSMVGYAYATEFFTALYSTNPYEEFAFLNRAFGPFGWAYGIMVGCNV